MVNMEIVTGGALGRREPTDFTHVDKYPYSAVAPKTVSNVEWVSKLPSWHLTHDQGNEGACEGFGNSMMMAILNGQQTGASVRYNPWWLWDRAKMVDEWPDTNPGDDNGTSGRAICDVMRSAGMLPVKQVSVQPEYAKTISSKVGDVASGIKANRWATTVDQMRAGIASHTPIAIGVNWYSGFDVPSVHADGSVWMDLKRNDTVRGGHCVCVYGASDARQAFRVKNSWGRAYPLVWLSYSTMQRLLNEAGEAALVTDR